MNLIMKNPLGTFTFEEGMTLSMAKAIRDAITGQWFNPKQYEDRLYDDADCHEFISRMSHVFNEAGGFHVDIQVPVPSKHLKKMHGGVQGLTKAFVEVEAAGISAAEAFTQFAEAMTGEKMG